MTIRARRTRLAATALALSMATALLAGCTADQSTPSTPAPVATSGGAPQPINPTPSVAPTFAPEGSAEDNFAFFSKIVAEQWAAGSGTNGPAYADALVAGGFDASTVQVTASKTTLDNDVESLQIAVLWQGTCLLGQVGSATGDPVATMLPELKDGGCFVSKIPER